MKLLGLDPGLRTTGWGVLDIDGHRLRHLANGRVSPPPDGTLAERLAALHTGLVAVIAEHRPVVAAIEETFVNRNAESTLKLGQARGVVLLTAALAGLAVHEYAAARVKQAVVGVGRADKEQVRAMVARILPGCALTGEDAADALAVAICHAHRAATLRRWGGPNVASLFGREPVS
ncbi:MAG: crossover junction endodeoxyribonuclease RuvC [Alphaproteobacteria bacterium]|nr:crossover junction endodeoxyribonuclease RuvC [Alphaproteobacteria bacterium]